MRYLDNPRLNLVELTDLRGAINQWRRARYVVCRYRSTLLDKSVAAARHIADRYPHLSPDLARLTSSRNPCLAFFSYLTLLWSGAPEAASCREQLAGRRFPVLVGSFLGHCDLDDTVQAAELYLKLYSPPEKPNA